MLARMRLPDRLRYPTAEQPRTRAGVHLSIVAQSLGHADTRMVEKHYATWRRRM